MASSSVPATPLLYSCIAYKNTILAEHTVSAASGTSSLASVILPKISHDSPQKLTYTHNQNLIHYIADAGSASGKADSLNAPNLTYMVVAKADLGRRVPFGFLVEIKKRFCAAYNPEHTDFSALPAYGAAAFNAQLKSLMIEYGTTKSGQEDAFKNVQGEIDNVRGIMTENIERVLERGERLDLLVDKTDRLGGSARDFRVRSRGLKRRMWWKNMKLMVMLVLVIVFLLYLMIGMGCGLPGRSTLTTFDIKTSTDNDNSMVFLRPPRLNFRRSDYFIQRQLFRRSSVVIPQ
jgi:vesicle-associated membrane protein 7